MNRMPDHRGTDETTANSSQTLETPSGVDATLVPISAERLQKLEELEAALPGMIELAIAEYKKSNLKRLHEKDKTDPESVKLRVYRYVQKHKEKINERRREKRKEKKEAAAAAAAVSAASVLSSQEGILSRTFHANEKDLADRVGSSADVSFPLIGVDGVTVRFDE